MARQSIDDASRIVVVLEVGGVDPGLRAIAQRDMPLLEKRRASTVQRALELRLALGDERLVRLVEVVRRHADLLRLRLGLERLLERHAGLAR